MYPKMCLTFIFHYVTIEFRLKDLKDRCMLDKHTVKYENLLLIWIKNRKSIALELCVQYSQVLNRRGRLLIFGFFSNLYYFFCLVDSHLESWYNTNNFYDWLMGMYCIYSTGLVSYFSLYTRRQDRCNNSVFLLISQVHTPLISY